MLVKVSARQTSYKSYGILVELKSKPIIADPNSETILKTADFADVICFCKVIHPLDLLDRRPNALFNSLVSETSKISGEAVAKFDFQILILNFLKFQTLAL